MNDDHTNEALLERRALAEKVCEGPWEKYCAKDIMAVRHTKIGNEEHIERFPIAQIVYSGGEAEAAHIAANSPDVVMADIDEIIRLRAENTWLDREAIHLATLLTLITDSEIGLDSQKSEVTRELVDQIKKKHSRTTVYAWRVAARKAVEEVEFVEENQ